MMNKREYLGILDQAMEGLPYNIRNEILADYAEHFRLGLEMGRTEEDIAESLGDPLLIASDLKRQYPPEHGASSEYGPSSGYGSSFEYDAPPEYDTPPQYGQRPEYGRRAMPPFSLMGALWRTFWLGMMNVIFVLGPYLAFVGVLIGFWGAALGLSLGGVAGIGALLVSWMPFTHTFVTVSSLSFFTIVTGSVFISSMGVLLGIGCWKTTKWFIRMSVRYASWNLRVITGRRY